jgi:hypothetical protein
MWYATCKYPKVPTLVITPLSQAKGPRNDDYDIVYLNGPFFE